jgi:P-type Cu+ transporter
VLDKKKYSDRKHLLSIAADSKKYIPAKNQDEEPSLLSCCVSVQQPHIRGNREGEKRSLLEVNEHFRPTDNNGDGADERLSCCNKHVHTPAPLSFVTKPQASHTAELVFDTCCAEKNEPENYLHDAHAHSYMPGRSFLSSFSLGTKLLITALLTLPLLAHLLTPLTFFSWSFLTTLLHTLHSPALQCILSTPVFIIGLIHFSPSAFRSTLRLSPNMNVLILLGSTCAYIYSIIVYTFSLDSPYFFETSASIITFALLGAFLEEKTLLKTQSALDDFLSLQPQQATVVRKNSVEASPHLQAVSYDELQQGDTVVTALGERIAVDGTVLQGEALIDESMITGESKPQLKKAGDVVASGGVLIQGSLYIEAHKVGQNTYLSHLIQIIKATKEKKPDIQRIGDAVSSVFVPLVLILSLMTFSIAYTIFAIPLSLAILHAIGVLVISCPCAMGLATPTALYAAVGESAKKGILIKGGKYLEELAKVKKILFDKTGTLTTGMFELQAIKIYKNLDEELIRSIIITLESSSTHPIAKSLQKAFSDSKLISLTNIVESPGKGIQGTDQKGIIWSFGSAALVSEGSLGYTLPPESVSSPQNNSFDHHPGITLFLFKDTEIAATVILKDEAKSDLPECLKNLRDDSIQTALLSGDKHENVLDFAHRFGFEEFWAEKTPEEKLSILTNLSQSSIRNPKAPRTAFIGDGINDAPSLTAAPVGISFNHASHIAIDAADVVIVNSDLTNIHKVILISRLTYKTIQQNLGWALLYNMTAIPFAAFGYVSPIAASLLMALSDIVVIGNSLYLKRKINKL